MKKNNQLSITSLRNHKFYVITSSRRLRGNVAIQKLFLAILINIIFASSAFAFEISNQAENNDGYIPYSRFIEKLDAEDIAVTSEMTDEQKAEADKAIDDLLNQAKSDFISDFDRSENQEIILYEGYSPVRIFIPTVHKKDIRLKDNNLDIAWLDEKLTKIGAIKYRTTDSALIYYLKLGSDRQCFIKVRNEYSKYIELFCSYLAGNNSTITITKDDFKKFGENRVAFLINSLPNKSQIARVNVKGDDDARLEMTYVSETRYEKHEERYYKRIDLEPKRSNDFVIDSLPTVDGQLGFRLEKRGEIDSVTIKFETGEDIPAIKQGSEYGMVVLKGIDPSLGAELVPYFDKGSGHDVLHSPILDDTGSFVFTAPAGYYKLLFGKNPYINISGRFFSHNIPVSAGEATEITIPSENSNSINELRRSYISSRKNKDLGNIQINNFTAKDNVGTIEMVVNDPLERDVFPEANEINVLENGVKGKITKIEREPQPVDVVLVLDSSGSMGDNMKPAVEAAKDFVNSLPDNTGIRFIQFAQKITIHKGEKKAEVIKALDTVKSIGATAMYDALDKALKLLEKKKKPYIVLFSDGADSREPGVDGKGSNLTKNQIIEKLKKSKATLLTIGFGKGHDPKTLKAMSEVTPNGMYVAAADKEALPSAFAAVSSKFGNQFKITYERPYTSVDSKSDVPVIAIMLDCSGSMDMDPKDCPKDDVGFRMDKIKSVFHDFIVGLPSNALMTFMSFTSGEIDSRQILTDNKPAVLKALSECKADGGTPINDALTFSLDNLKSISSSKRILIFFTDAALDSESKDSEEKRVKYEELLKNLKKQNIRVLFAGLGGEDYISKYKAPFEEAAKMSGGDYIITAKTQDIADKLTELLKKVDEPVSDKKALNLSLALDCKTDDGSRMNYSAVKTFEEIQPLEKQGEVVKPGTLTVKTGEKYAFKPKADAESLVAGSKKADSTEVFCNIKYENAPKANNKFAEIEAQELYLLKKFKGFNPQKNAFAALKIKMTFKKADEKAKEKGYEIPSIFNHFYLSLNNSSLVAPSKLTWLADKPLTKEPEKVSVFVDDNNFAEGFLIFDMPFAFYNTDDKSGIQQLSLHLFDESNGHIELPIVGKMSKKLESIKSLPNKEPQKISDAFSLKIKGYEDRRKIADKEFYEDDKSNFRIIEADFISNVSALLDINPLERFYYAVETDNGPLMTRMSNIVYSMPLGFVSKLKFAPGSFNTVRMPFVVGNKLASAPSYIWGDVAKGEVKCSVSDGKVWNSKKLGQKFSHQYFDLVINDFGRLEDKRFAAVDFTITDKPDNEGLGTGGLTTLLALQCSENIPDNLEKSGNGGTIIKVMTRKGLGNFGSVDYKMPGRAEFDISRNRNYLYSIDDKWGVFDGMSRRGVIIFDLDNYKDSDKWELISDYITSLKIKLPNEPFSNKALLAKTKYIEVDYSLDRLIDEAVREAKINYDATHKDIDKTPAISLNSDDKPLTTVAVPSLTLFGTEKINSIKNEKELLDLFSKLKVFLDMGGELVYSSEAVISKGYGSDAELTALAEELLINIGFTPVRRTVALTKNGFESIKARVIGKFDDDKELNALEYKSNRKNLLFVPAFGKYLSDLKGLCYYKKHEKLSIYDNEKTIDIIVYGKLIGDAGVAAQQAIASDIFGALGGREASKTDDGIIEPITLLRHKFNLKDFSTDIFDLSFQSSGKSSDGKGEIICAVLDTPKGLCYDKNLWVDTSCYEIQSVTVKLDDRIQTTRYLKEGKKPTDLHISFGISLPELTDEAVKVYEEAIKIRAEGLEDVSDYARVKWQTHAAIARFLKAYNNASDKISQKTEVLANRIVSEDSLCVAAICESNGKEATIGLDLMNIGHRRGNNGDKQRMFNNLIGLVSSQLEAAVLPGGKGKSYLDVWATLPEEAGIFVIDREIKKKAGEYLKDKDLPKLLVDRINNERLYNHEFIVPTAPGVRNGEECWAWLEIDNDKGVILSMFDNGERSGLAGYVIGLTPYNECNFAAGAVIGITCSNFAVSAYTLQLDDEEAVWESSEKLCKTISSSLGTAEGLMSAKDFQSAATGFAASQAGGFSKKHTGIDFNEVYKNLKIMRGDAKYNPTFSDGFKMAVELYFN